MFILKSSHVKRIKHLQELFLDLLESGKDLCQEVIRLGVENEQLKAEVEDLKLGYNATILENISTKKTADNRQKVLVLLVTLRDTMKDKNQELSLLDLVHWTEPHLDISNVALRSLIARVIRGEKLMERTRRGYYKFL
jgi:hypothetical protein